LKTKMKRHVKCLKGVPNLSVNKFQEFLELLLMTKQAQMSEELVLASRHFS